LLGDLFVVELPAVPCESTLEYFLLAASDRETVVTDPLDTLVRLHSAEAVSTSVLFEDDFEKERGWETVVEGGDTTTGAWTRVIPAATLGQTAYDYSPDAGRHCYVTGQLTQFPNAIRDVDGGPVRLISPVIALPALDVEVAYARWFFWSGAGEEDFLTVEFSLNDGTDWTTVEVVASTDAWVAHSFRLSDFPEVEGDQLRIRFSTADSPDDSLTEAAVDELSVRAIRCAVVRGDANEDGVVDRDDFSEMLQCWEGPGRVFLDRGCDALDFDRNRRVDLFDFRAFQASFGPP
jgi:hypothetical protein